MDILTIQKKDRDYLRELAKKLYDISMNPEWEKKVILWEKKNALTKVRPLILFMLPEEVWPELIPASNLRIEKPYWRSIEWDLLKRIYRYEKIKDDYIIDNKLYIPIRYSLSDWYPGRKRPYAGDGKKAEKFYPSIENYTDLNKIKTPVLLDIDYELTKKEIEASQEVFGEFLNVIKNEPFYAGTDSIVTGWGLSAVDLLCELRGLENIFYDMVDNPEFVHDAMHFITKALIGYLDQMEAEGLLSLNNNSFCKNSNTPLGSNGLACLDNTQKIKSDHKIIKSSHLWGYLMAQEFALISPEMTDEFVYSYQQEIAKRFDLICYGCCEPNDAKWNNIISRFENLRAVSISHASDLDVAAEKIANKYVFSWKPHSMLIEPFEDNHIKDYLSHVFELTKDCHLVCSMRDNLTLFGEADKVEKWVNIAMSLAEMY